MLGRLARWLRLLGFDCSYRADIPDAELVEHAWRDGRVILTRDRRLLEEWRVSGIHLVRAEHTGEQLREVLRAFELLDGVRLFSRCSACNRLLEETSRQAARGRAPRRVLEAEERFWECPECKRVYWRGSHTDRIRRVVEGLRS
jgi:uncharacterized protein with PIN domain